MTLDRQYRQALNYFEKNNFVDAINCLNASLAINPNHPDSVCLRGIIDFEEGRLQEAKECFDHVIDLVPDHNAALIYLPKVAERIFKVKYLAEFIGNRDKYKDFPRFVGIETVGRCNANCNFCPHESLDRKHTEMDDDLFDKIISDLEEIPPHVPIRIIPNLVNEPFMDRKIFSRLTTINERLPSATLAIFTNLNVVSRSFLSDLSQIKNINLFNISFNAGNEKEYEDTMKIDFQRTVENINSLLRANREKTFLSNPIILSRVASLTDADGHYVDECIKIFSDYSIGIDFEARVKNRANWLGKLASEQSVIPKEMPCNAWFDLNIFCTGVVPHCCMDANGQYSIGDVRDSSVLEIYNDIKFKFMREKLAAREETHPCNTCSLFQ